MKMLATDLDGTFLGGTLSDRRKLYKRLREEDDILLVFVTGRGLQSVITLLANEEIPYPDYIICDVGATIMNAHSMEAIPSLDAAIKNGWPGEKVVMQVLAGVEGLVRQPVPQRRRCSFYLEDPSKLTWISELVKSINCETIFSANRYLDVLPKGVNKGSSLKALVSLLDISPNEVLVAGDTLNDLAMYQYGFRGVVVGNAEPGLVKETQSITDIMYAQAEGAGAILEVFDNFDEASAGASQLWNH